jgi:hypothetical protein
MSEPEGFPNFARDRSAAVCAYGGGFEVSSGCRDGRLCPFPARMPGAAGARAAAAW